MSFGSWVFIGMVASFIASKLVLRTGDGLLRDLALGVGGAVLGGALARYLSGADGGGGGAVGIAVTFAGAAVALFVYHRFFASGPDADSGPRSGRKTAGRR